MERRIWSRVFTFVGLLLWAALASPQPGEVFEDAPLTDAVQYPPWFRLSFLDLREDLQEVAAAGKRGLVVYFGQKYCPYCKAMMENDFGRPDIERYTRHYFEVVPMDIHGDRQVIDLAGREWTEKSLADHEKTTFTPSLLFYDTEGREALRLRGYYPPYKFRAALEYVAYGHYRRESFRDYLERADPPFAFELGGLNEADFFAAPPHNFDRSRRAGERPLALFFEQRDCHSCDVLHTAPLQSGDILALMEGFDAAQLDIWADTPVITPSGNRTSSREWARALGLFYTPTVIFYDLDGGEILRVDSVAHFYRLRRALRYVLSGAHREGIPLQRWDGGYANGED